jgi:hypothetical protein
MSAGKFRAVFAVPAILLAIACLVPFSSAQQSTNAQISGLVSDSSGASVSEASVKAIDTGTDVEYTSVSNDAGVYVLPQLVPGRYRLTVSKTGFKTLVHSEITLRIGDRLSLNFGLEPGTVQTTVDVIAGGELLTTDDASYSTVLDNSMITELPQLSRSTLDLTKVTPAVQGDGPHKLGSVGADYNVGIAGTSYALAGGQRNGTLITVDGAISQEMEIGAVNRSVPSPDAVGEFRVQTGVLPADVGRYSGGVITISTKSGTNEYHGRLFFYGRNQNLNANSWQNNTLGVDKQRFHQNNYGLALGGPVIFPKVYNGKNRTFFFFAWEGQRFSTSNLATASVPTEAERNGDFSKSIINYQNGKPVYAQIFDMFSGYTDAQGNFIRPIFPNATIPKSHQVQLMPYYLSLWPMPNHAPDANTSSTNDYYTLTKPTEPSDRQTLRLDENYSEHNRLQLRASHYRASDIQPAPFFHAAGQNAFDRDWSGSLDYNWIPNPTTVFEVRLGTAIAKLLTSSGSDEDSSINTDKWPFDPYLFSGGERSKNTIPPGMNFVSAPFYTGVGGFFYDGFRNQVYNGSLSFSKILNRHTLKVGYQHIWSISDELGGDASGAVNVSNGGGSNQYWNNPNGLTGDSLAEFMLGSASFFNWGNFNISPNGPALSAYVMDDWKVNKKLTVQLGLRYDHESGRKPRYPYGAIFDLKAQNVLKPNAGWSWDQVVSAVPGVANYPQPAWVTQGVNGREALINTPEYPRKTLFSPGDGLFQPRIGISYGLDSQTVLHASYGLVFQGYSGLQTEYGGSFYYGTDTFSQIDTIDGKHWISEFGLDHGLGNFPLLPDGSRLGYTHPVKNNQGFWNITYGTCSNPIGICYAAPGQYKDPYEQSWGFSVQRRLGNTWVVSAEYTGIKGVNLVTPAPFYQYTNISPAYYSLGSSLLAQVPNPFFGQSQTFQAQPTVPLSQLLSSMPQYSSAGPGYLTDGRSLSNFVNFQAQSRNFHGLSLLASYNVRKTLVNNVGKDQRQPSLANGSRVFQNPNDLNESYGVALYENPQTLLLNYSYELPFGRGKHFMGALQGWSGRITDWVAGGWGFAGVTTWWPKGTPVLGPHVQGSVAAPGASVRWSVSGSNYLNPNVDYASAIVVQGAFVNPNPQTVFNHSVFVRTPDYSFGNIPVAFPNVRNPGGFSTDTTLFKNFYFTENRERYLNLRLEALNFFNHPNFGPVDNNPDSPTFGGILGKIGDPRVMQIGLRLFF